LVFWGNGGQSKTHYYYIDPARVADDCLSITVECAHYTEAAGEVPQNCRLMATGPKA